MQNTKVGDALKTPGNLLQTRILKVDTDLAEMIGVNCGTLYPPSSGWTRTRCEVEVVSGVERRVVTHITAPTQGRVGGGL